MAKESAGSNCGVSPLRKAAIGYRQLVEKHADRPAVADDVVSAEDEDMLVDCQTRDEGAGKRAVDKVEGRPCILVEHLPKLRFAVGPAGQIHQRRLQREIVGETEVIASATEADSKRIMAIRHKAQCL